jgi:hypothetical protein
MKRNGDTKHPLYWMYHGMLSRCYNPNNPRYDDWGGRGIKVCKQWRTNFLLFVEDMGPRPEGYLIDRIDNDGDYKPTNCRWVSPRESRLNQRPRTHCKHGHELTKENSYLRPLENGVQKRTCRICQNIRCQEYRERKRAS